MKAVQSIKGEATPALRIVRHVAGAALLMVIASAWHKHVFASSEPVAEKITFATELPNVKGKRITVVTVNYAPGGLSPSHKHAGSVVACVTSGEIRSQNSETGPVNVYKSGECFFEPPGSVHLISENASKTKAASLLAIFVADDNATLTRPVP